MILSFLFIKNINSHHNPIRIGCLPILEHQSDISIFVAEEIAKQLQDCCLENYNIVRYEWVMQSFNPDSAFSQSYVISYGERIGLDLVILFKSKSIKNGSYPFHVTFCKISQGKRRIFEIDYPLNMENIPIFFEKVSSQIGSLTGIKIHPQINDSWPQVNVWEKLSRVRYHQLQQQWGTCEEIYREIVKLDSTNISLLKEFSGFLLLQSIKSRSQGKQPYDRLYTVETILNSVAQTDSMDGIVDRMFGLLYVLQERWNKAEEAFRMACKKSPNDPFLYFYLSRLHPSRSGALGFKNKESLLKKTLQINPAMVWAYLALGEIYCEKQHYHEAEDNYSQLLKITPNSLDGLLALGKLYSLQNKMTEMVQVYEKIMHIAPHLPDSYYNLGIIAYHYNKIDQAMKFFKKATTLGEHVDAAFYRAIIFEQQGEVDSAIACYQKTLRLHQGLSDDYREDARKNLLNLIQYRQEPL